MEVGDAFSYVKDPGLDQWLFLSVPPKGLQTNRPG